MQDLSVNDVTLNRVFLKRLKPWSVALSKVTTESGRGHLLLDRLSDGLGDVVLMWQVQSKKREKKGIASNHMKYKYVT